MDHDKNTKIFTEQKQETNLPSIPNLQGGFENLTKISSIIATIWNHKWNDVDSLLGMDFSGRVEGFTLSQPLMLFFDSRGWI